MTEFACKECAKYEGNCGYHHVDENGHVNYEICGEAAADRFGICMKYEDRVGDKRKIIDNCPFCGGPALLFVTNTEVGDTSRKHKIYCSHTNACGAEMSTYLSCWSKDYEKQLNDFINRWNRRI